MGPGPGPQTSVAEIQSEARQLRQILVCAILETYYKLSCRFLIIFFFLEAILLPQWQFEFSPILNNSSSYPFKYSLFSILTVVSFYNSS